MSIENETIRRDLGVQLLTLYIFLVGPFIFASIFLYRYANTRLEENVKSADLALAKAIAQETEITLNNSLTAIKELGRTQEVIKAHPKGMERLFATAIAVRPDINLIYRLDANGIMLYHYPPGPVSAIGADFSYRTYFQRAKLTTQPLVSKGRLSSTTNQAVATIVMPLWDYSNGEFLGVVAADMKLEYLSQILRKVISEFHPEEQILATIIDSSGHIIAHSDSNLLLQQVRGIDESILESIILGRSGAKIATSDNDSEMLISYMPIQNAGWGVIIGRSTAVAFETPKTFSRMMLAAIGTFILIGGFFWFSLSHQVIRPLEHLSAISQKIGQGYMNVTKQNKSLQLMSRRADQIGYLIRSITSMEEAIEARLQELATLLDTSAAVLSTLDIQKVLDLILEQVGKLLEIDKSVILSLDTRTNKFVATASRGLSKHYTSQISIDPSEPQSVTMRAIRTGHAIQISDTETDPTFSSLRPRARAEGYRSVIAVPLKTNIASPAALVLFRTKPHVFSEREINLITSFANHAAMALENATLYSLSDTQLKEQTRRLEALIQSMNDGLILADLSGKVIYTNHKILELIDINEHMVNSITIDDIYKQLIQKSKTNTVQEPQSLIAKLIKEQSIELDIQTSEKRKTYKINAFQVTDSRGVPIGSGQIFRDITADKELEQMKNTLLSTVSHELRTPLASIKGYASTLLAEDIQWDAQTQREFLKIISDETDRLSSLVTDILDLSKVESGIEIIHPTQTPIQELVKNAIASCIPNPSHRLEINIAEDISSIYVDNRKIETVLKNLIENAAKYSPKDTPIYLKIFNQENNVVFQVIDEGPGIPTRYQHDIFKSFYRLKTGTHEDIPGTGLGLAICQGFVNAHGGKIWVESKPVGTCISFSIPNKYEARILTNA